MFVKKAGRGGRQGGPWKERGWSQTAFKSGSQDFLLQSIPVTQIQRLVLDWLPPDQVGASLERQTAKPHSRRL